MASNPRSYPAKRLTIDVRRDELFAMPDGPYRFVKELSGARLLLQHEITGYDRPIDEDEFVDLIGKGLARRVRDPPNRRRPTPGDNSKS